MVEAPAKTGAESMKSLVLFIVTEWCAAPRDDDVPLAIDADQASRLRRWRVLEGRARHVALICRGQVAGCNNGKAVGKILRLRESRWDYQPTGGIDVAVAYNFMVHGYNLPTADFDLYLLRRQPLNQGSAFVEITDDSHLRGKLENDLSALVDEAIASIAGL